MTERNNPEILVEGEENDAISVTNVETPPGNDSGGWDEDPDETNAGHDWETNLDNEESGWYEDEGAERDETGYYEEPDPDDEEAGWYEEQDPGNEETSWPREENADEEATGHILPAGSDWAPDPPDPAWAEIEQQLAAEAASRAERRVSKRTKAC